MLLSRVAYARPGPLEAPPRVLSTSLGRVGGLWDDHTLLLSRGFRVLAYDPGGQGAYRTRARRVGRSGRRLYARAAG